MSAIRPDLPSVQFPPQPAGQAPARAARSDFFKAALDAVQAGGTEPPPRAAPAAPSTAAREERPSRPGSLLDIRV
ncbi:MAG: hypothetical protein K2Y04_12375 [Caulobacteraceae bacterium]|jgi:hypothetical protein|nr:hypothetical protein [Caulobacteraceae bacterium]